MQQTGENRMAMGRREKDIKLLVAKFVKLVESLNPGERLSIKKIAAERRPAAQPRRAVVKTAGKTAGKMGGKTERKAAAKTAGKAAARAPKMKASG
jgi:hypothetical protein